VLTAAPQSSGGGNGLTLLILMVLFIGVFYVFMIRPQAKKRREALQMQSTIGPGAQVVTIGGLHGTVTAIEDDTVLLEIAPGTVVRFARPAIGQVKSSGAEAEAVEPEPEAVEPVVAQPVSSVVEEPVQSPVVDTRKKD
jgi:preprotein translocase subunit YajC